jgi:FkbM family methyltransferase
VSVPGRLLARARAAFGDAPRLAGPRVVEAFASAYPSAFFIEIGANDGEQHDHLRPAILAHPWRGIMVEPVPHVFERLRRNYGSMDRITLERAAIADRDGTIAFFHLREAAEHERSGLPDWYDAIGSFSRESLLAHRRVIPDIESWLVETRVPALTFESLCRKHDVSTIDLLLVDTEGYDREVIRRVDFEARRPRLVVYEHYHLPPAERVDCRSHMRSLGYEVLEEGFDTWCLDPAGDALTRAWGRLSPGAPSISVYDEPGGPGDPGVGGR